MIPRPQATTLWHVLLSEEMGVLVSFIAALATQKNQRILRAHNTQLMVPVNEFESTIFVKSSNSNVTRKPLAASTSHKAILLRHWAKTGNAAPQTKQ